MPPPIPPRLHQKRRLRRRTFLVLLLPCIVTLAAIRTERQTFPGGGTYDAWEYEIKPGCTIYCWLRVNPHGWPTTFFEAYRYRWFTLARSEPRGKNTSDSYRTQHRVGLLKHCQENANNLNQWDQSFLRLTTAYPQPNGVIIHWSGLLGCALAGTVAAALVAEITSRPRRIVILLKRRLLRRRGHCRRCGYDLRGSHHSGKCPECGTPWRWADKR